jgi:hypothetical protein
MKVNIEGHTNGKGLWSEEARVVLITKIGFGYQSTVYYSEDPWFGELRAYFEPSGFTPGSWNVPGYGLIYTDKLWLKEFKAGLRELGFSRRALQVLSYSEQGMQGNDYVSMDAGTEFYTSWQRLVKEGKLHE